MDQVRPHFHDVDEIWHAGDWQDPRVLDELKALGHPLYVVNGNAPDDPSFPDHIVRKVEGLTIGMVHRPPSPGIDWVSTCQVVIHGHTHRWRDQTVDGVRFVNVSTPTAAGFSQERTIGILRISGTIAELEKIQLSR